MIAEPGKRAVRWHLGILYIGQMGIEWNYFNWKKHFRERLNKLFSQQYVQHFSDKSLTFSINGFVYYASIREVLISGLDWKQEVN